MNESTQNENQFIILEKERERVLKLGCGGKFLERYKHSWERKDELNSFQRYFEAHANVVYLPFIVLAN